MEAILANLRRATRRAVPVVPGLTAPAGVAVLLPGASAGEWLLCRPTGTDPTVAPTRQSFDGLEAAAAALQPTDEFVLALPIEMGLVQRLTLPAAAPDELEEMARIQLEKILPYPVEAIGLSLQEISRSETDVVLGVASIHRDRLMEICQPLLAQGCWPRRVAFYPLVLAGTAPADENTAFLYQSAGKTVLAICEGSSLCFAQVLAGKSAEELSTELPATLLGAELEGVPSSFGSVRLDERLTEWRDVLAAVLGTELTPFDMTAAALRAAPQPDGDLSPAEWQAERQRGVRRARLQKQLLTAAAVYGGILLLGFLWLGVRKLQVAYLDSRLKTVQPQADYSRQAMNHWHVLGPAVEPGESMAEALRLVYEVLPPGDTVLLTGFNFKAGNLTVTGEAPSSAAAVDYTEKLKAVPQLRPYHLEADQPTLQGGRWQFRAYTPVN